MVQYRHELFINIGTIIFIIFIQSPLTVFPIQFKVTPKTQTFSQCMIKCKNVIHIRTHISIHIGMITYHYPESLCHSTIDYFHDKYKIKFQ